MPRTLNWALRGRFPSRDVRFRVVRTECGRPFSCGRKLAALERSGPSFAEVDCARDKVLCNQEEVRMGRRSSKCRAFGSDSRPPRPFSMLLGPWFLTLGAAKFLDCEHDERWQGFRQRLSGNAERGYPEDQEKSSISHDFS